MCQTKIVFLTIHSMEPTPTAISAVVSMFDRIPNEVLFQLGQFLDKSTLFSSIQVCRLWHLTLLPLLWVRIDQRQWHRPSFPLLPLLHPKQVHRVHKSVRHSSYTSAFVQSLLRHVRQLEWWSNSEMAKTNNRRRHRYTQARFKSVLSPSARAAESRGDRSIEPQDWCFDVMSRLDSSDTLRMIPMQRLSQLLLEELPNLTSVSLRLGPYEDADTLRSLIHLPKSMRDLRLVSIGWDGWGRTRMAIEDLFPLFSRLEELELKGYWFYCEPNHPWYHSDESGSASSTVPLQLPGNFGQSGITTVTTLCTRLAWKLKRLDVNANGLFLAQNCPQLVEFNLNYAEPPGMMRLWSPSAIPSFKPLEACKNHLRILNFFKITMCCPELTDLVETWTQFEHLTDLTYVVHDVDTMLFLCEQQGSHPTHHRGLDGQDNANVGETTTATAMDPRNEFLGEGEIDYPHVYLPHLQHLTINYLNDPTGIGQRQMISHCLYWILMTRTKLLTFKAPNIYLDQRLIAPNGLLDLEPSRGGSNSDSRNGVGSGQKVPITPSPLWPSTVSLKEKFLNMVPWIVNGSTYVDVEFLTPRPNRFWACSQLETLNISVVPSGIDSWRPIYRQLAELSELRSLSLVGIDLEKGADSGILQLADGLSEVDSPRAIEDSPPIMQGGSNSSSNGLHDLSYRPFMPKLTKLRHLTFHGDTPSEWTRDEIRRLLLLLPSLEQLKLKPLLHGSLKNVVQWLQEFGGVQDQDATTPQSGSRRIPVQIL